MTDMQPRGDSARSWDACYDDVSPKNRAGRTLVDQLDVPVDLSKAHGN